MREKILAAAGRLFADKGFDGVSLRELTARANVNLAAVNYYFGTKERLYEELVKQQIRPLNEARLALLAGALSDAGAEPVPLEEILGLLIQPALDAYRNAAEGGPTAVRIQARCLSDPPMTFLNSEMKTEYQLVLSRFSQAIRRHVPQLSPEDFLWRFTFIVGALQHALANLHQMSEQTRGICRNADFEGVCDRFVTFAAATLRFGA